MVGLVKHQHLHPGKIDRPLADMVEEPAGTGHHDFCAAPQLVHLGRKADASVNGNAPETGLPSQAADRFMNLLGQFARRSDNEGPNMPASTLRQAMQDRQREGSGLAGAGLGQAQYIAPLHNRRDRPGLDRRRPGITRSRYSGRDKRMKIKRIEFHKTPFFCIREQKSPGVFRGLQ